MHSQTCTALKSMIGVCRDVSLVPVNFVSGMASLLASGTSALLVGFIIINCWQDKVDKSFAERSTLKSHPSLFKKVILISRFLSFKRDHIKRDPEPIFG